MEDNHDDVVVVTADLRRAGYAPVVERVETATGMTAALAAGPWDLVLSDSSMRGFSALDALQLLHTSGQDLPFIIVSGNIQEEEAVAALRAGAHDFVVKDRLSRLAPAIARELRDAEERAAQRRGQTARQELEAGYQLLFANSPLPMWMYDPQTLQFVEVNEAAIATYGYSREEFLQMRITDIRPAEDVPRLMQNLAEPRGDFRPAQTWRHIRKDGSLRDVEIAAHTLEIGGRALSLVVVNDVTDRKQAEVELANERNTLRAVIDNVPDFIYAKDTASRFTLINRASAASLGRTPEEVVGKTDFDLHPPELAAQFLADEQAVMRSGQPLVDREEMMYEKGQERWQLTTTVPLRDGSGKVTGMVGISRNITERRRAEGEIKRHAKSAEVLARTAAHLNRQLDLMAVITAVCQEAIDTFGVFQAGMSLYDEKRDLLVFAGGVNIPPEFLAIMRPMTRAQFDEWFRAMGPIIVIPDVQSVPGLPNVELHAGQNLRTVVSSTMLRGQALVGTLTLGVAGEVREFTQDELTLLKAITDEAAQAVANARLHQDLQQELLERQRAEEVLRRRLADLEAVSRISAALRTAQTLDDLLAKWLDLTLEAMNANGGGIWLYDPLKEELRPAVIRGWTTPAGAGPVRPEKPGEGVNGLVFVSGQPYVSRNFALDPLVAEGARERIPAGGGVGIPIRVGDGVIGTFVVNMPLGRDVRPDDVHLLTTLAEIAGSAIQRTRFLEQTEQRLGQLSALRAIDEAISASLDLNLTLAVFLDHVLTQLGVDAADVLLLEPHEQMLRYAAGRGFRTREFQQARTRVGEGRAGRAVLERQIVVADLNDAPPASKRTGLLGGEGFVSYLGVPLIAKGQVLGALEIFHRSRLDPAPEWMSFLSALAGQAAIALDNASLFDGLQRSNTDLQLAYDATIEGWSRALDLRDKETEGHSQRVTHLTEQLAAVLGMPENQIVHLRRGALLHDIGKMGVPDDILLKPGPLTSDEWTIMRQHPAFAYEMLAPIHYLRPALEIPYCHHEKWDGTGYPRGLRGDLIPSAARMFAVVDVWDALRSDRPYRRAWPAEKVREYIRQQTGQHFDPLAAETFLRMDFSDKR